jgi:hypothetical protein
VSLQSAALFEVSSGEIEGSGGVVFRTARQRSKGLCRNSGALRRGPSPHGSDGTCDLRRIGRLASRHEPLGRSGLVAGELILFHAAGAGDPDASSFIGVGEIAGQMVADAVAGGGLSSDEVTRVWRSTEYRIPIANVSFFALSVQVLPLVSELEFFPNKERWGGRLAGAFHRISSADVDRFLRAAGGS